MNSFSTQITSLVQRTHKIKVSSNSELSIYDFAFGATINMAIACLSRHKLNYESHCEPLSRY